MRLILKGSSSPIRHKIKKEKNASSSLFSTPPQGLDCVTYSYAIVYSILTFPLNPPLAKGDFARVLANGYINKKIRWKNHRTSCCTPSGARTLDPNIKSVVLYQLS